MTNGQAVEVSASMSGLQSQVKRLVTMKEQVQGMSGDVRAKLDYLIGCGAEEAKGPSPEPVPSGVLGELAAHIGALEDALNSLNQHVGELVSNARI